MKELGSVKGISLCYHYSMRLKEVLGRKTVFAFNCDDLVIYRGVVEAVKEMGLPVILQISPGEMNFWGLERFVVLSRQEKLPIFLNFDHCRDLVVAEKVIDLGFDMIHFDGSDLPWEENLVKTKDIVEMAHKKGILVEGEPERDDTQPDRVKEFINRTGVDLVAVFVGNHHGIDPSRPERLRFDQLLAIKKAAAGTSLTLHGGSGVEPAHLKRVIDERLVAKINVNSWLRFAYRRRLEKELREYDGLKIYRLLEPVVLAIKKEVKRCLM